jgi:hypothetical protein
MGRPDDVRIKREKKNSEIETLKELVKQQSEMIKCLVDTLTKSKDTPSVIIQNVPTRMGDHDIPGDERPLGIERPKMDSFFINPSSELKITDAANLDKNKEEKIVQENIDEEAEKLKALVKRKNK